MDTTSDNKDLKTQTTQSEALNGSHHDVLIEKGTKEAVRGGQEEDTAESDMVFQTSLTQNETLSASNEMPVESDTMKDSDQQHDGIARSSSTKYRTPTGLMPRQWLTDRCDGTSKYNPESRPPCRICYVPLPVKWFPDLLEQNCLCETLGRTGCIDPENTCVRRNLFRAAFIINVIGLLCLIVSMFAITEDHYNFLWRTEFTKVWLQLIEGPADFVNVPVFWAVGLRAIAFDNTLRDENGMAAFGEICAILNNEREYKQQQQNVDSTLLLVASEPEFQCNHCEEISRRIVPSLFLSMLSYIPNFTTDILRMYSNYDVNCQKFLASTFSWISLATAIYTWVNYRKGCFDSLSTEPFAVNQDFERVDFDSPDVYLVVRYAWQAGLGQICLGVATFLKIVDIVINIVLPTPTITRDYLEQVEYEWKYGHANDDDKDEEECVQRDGDDVDNGDDGGVQCARLQVDSNGDLGR